MDRYRPSLKQISQILGVSQATVSLVLHDRPGVSGETREKVAALLKMHGYIEDVSASNHSIHLLKYAPTCYYTRDVRGKASINIDTIGLYARTFDYDVTITSCHEGELLKVLDVLCEDPLDGMIVIGNDLPLIYSDYFDRYSKPMVLVGTSMPACKRDALVIDHYSCIHDCVKYLYEAGKRQICYITSCFHTYNTEERSKAFIRVAEEFGLPIHEDSVLRVNPSSNRYFEMLIRVMKSNNNFPTAIIADSEVMALGIMRAMHRMGLRIPEDSSIISLADSVFCQLSDPAITSFKISEEHLGRIAVDMLLKRIANKDFPINKNSIGGELVVRHTVNGTSIKK